MTGRDQTAARIAATRAIREECGWTQADAAEICCVTKRTFERWEAGRGVPLGALKLLCLEAEVPYPPAGVEA